MNDLTPEHEADLERIKRSVATLGEFFDTVQVFCTKSIGEDAGNTTSFHTGSGNWFARYGQVREWLIKKDEQAREEARGDD